MGHGKRILDGLTEAAETAALAARVAVVIQNAQHEGITATRTAYRVLDCLGLASIREFDFAPPPATEGER